MPTRRSPSAAKIVEATFEFPYLAHAALEPLNAVARMQDGVLEVWGGHQIPDLYQGVAAEIAGIPPEQVKLHVMMTGGGFGRRAVHRCRHRRRGGGGRARRSAGGRRSRCSGPARTT